MGLTLFSIQNAKPGERPYQLTDGNGLHLLVDPNGSKLWRFRYRHGGRQKMISLGAFPDVPLAAAREKRDEARKLVAAGADPSQIRKDVKRAEEISAANTFGLVALEYIEKCEAEGIADQTGYKKRWLLLELAK